MKKVRFLTSVSDARKTFDGGRAYALTDSDAKEWVTNGIAVYLRPSKVIQASVKGWRSTIRPGDIYNWQVKVKLPKLARPFIRRKNWAASDRPISRRRTRSKYLQEVGGFSAEVSRSQAATLDYLVANEAKILSKLARAVAKYSGTFWGGWVKNVGRRLAELIVPQKMTAEQVVKRIKLSTVEVSMKTRSGMSYLAIQGHCTWDVEHGFTAVFHRDRVVTVCQQGTGWVDRRSRRKN